ncbi:MAG TPA: amidohydrolase family protein [Allosphingosinicella sp.]|nr:amidohydrolase family protein [Allosphingosinicella sp.]
MSLGLIFMAAMAGAQPAPEPSSNVIVIRGATLIDTAGERDVDDSTVIIAGGRIKAVGRKLPIPPDARVIEARGKYLIPGLIDGHVHFFQSGGLYTRPDSIDLRSQVPYADEVAAIRRRMGDTFMRYTVAGVTGAVDMGGPMSNFDLRDQAAANPNAPRLWVAGPLLSPYQPPALVAPDPPILKTESVEDARVQARAELARKPDFLKYWYIVGKDGPAAGRPLLTAMVAEGRAAGVRTAVHATQLETARAAVEEGASVLVHSVDDKPVDRAFVDAVRSRHVYYIPTLIVIGRYGEAFGRRNPLTPYEKEVGNPEVVASFDRLADATLPDYAAAASVQLGGMLPLMQRNLMRMYLAGVPIVMGTDAGNIGTLHAASVTAEMKAMAAAGMPPRAVLASATIVAARMLGAEGEIGTVDVGKTADLVLLGEDPRVDAGAVEDVELVVRGGRIVAGTPELYPVPVAVSAIP